MPRNNQVAEVFIKVVADSKEALKGVAKQVKATEALAQQQKAMNKAAENQAQKLKKLTDKQNKALDDAAKKNKESLKSKLKEGDFYKKEEARLKRQIAMQDKERNLREKSVRSFVKEANRIERAQRDYHHFLERSHRENSRFFDKLSRQDFTKSFTENFRRGMQKGKLLTSKFHPDENYLQGMSRSLGIAATALDRTKSFAERTAETFYKLQAVGMTLQTALAIVGGVIGDLIGGFMSLLAIAGQLVVSLVAVGGVFASFIAGMIGAKVALGGVGQAVSRINNGQKEYNRSLAQARKAMKDLRFEAESAALAQESAAIALTKARMQFFAVQDLPPNNLVYQEALLDLKRAELAVRKAKAAADDINKEIKGGGQLAVVAANSPFKNLTKSQITFTKYLVTLRPQLRALKEAAAQSFLPPLQTAIETIVTYAFPLFEKGLKNVNTAMGESSKIFANTFKDPAVARNFIDFTKNAQPVIRDLGSAMSDAFAGLLGLLVAAAPVTERFSKSIATAAKSFRDFTNRKPGDNTLVDYFNRAGEVAARSGTVVKTVMKGISNTMDAAFPENGKGGGWTLLAWFQAIADNFQNFTGASKFGTWLDNSTGNLTEAIDTIGAFAHVFIDLAGNPDIKTFWVRIREAAPDFIKIFTEGAKAAPELAEVFNNMIKFFSIVAESGAIKAFLGAMGVIFGIFAKIAQILAPIINAIATFHGYIIALYVAGRLFNFVFKVLLGLGEKSLRVLGGGQAFITRFWAGGTAAINLQTIALKRQLTAVEKLRTRIQTLFGQNVVQKGLRSQRNFDQLRVQALALYGLTEKTLKSRGKDTAAARAAFRTLETELLQAKSRGVIALGQFVAGAEAGNSGLRSMYYGSYLVFKILNGIKTVTTNIGVAFKNVFTGMGNLFKRLAPILDRLTRPIRRNWAFGGNQIAMLEAAVSKLTGTEVKLNGVLRARLRIQALFGKSIQVTEGVGNRNYNTLVASLDKMKAMGRISKEQRDTAVTQLGNRREMLFYKKSDLTRGIGLELNKFRFLTETVLGRFVVNSLIAFQNFKDRAIDAFKKATTAAKDFAVKSAATIRTAFFKLAAKGVTVGGNFVVGFLKGLDNLVNKLGPLETKIKLGINKLVGAIKIGALSVAQVGSRFAGKAFIGAITGFEGILGGIIKLAERLAPLENKLRAKIRSLVNTVRAEFFKLVIRGITTGGNLTVGLLQNLANFVDKLTPIETKIRAKLTSLQKTIRVGFLKFQIAGITTAGNIATGVVNSFFDLVEKLAPLENRLRAGLNRVVMAIKTPLLNLTARGITASGNFVVGFLQGLDNLVNKLGPLETKIKVGMVKLVGAIKIGALSLAQSGVRAAGNLTTKSLTGAMGILGGIANLAEDLLILKFRITAKFIDLKGAIKVGLIGLRGLTRIAGLNLKLKIVDSLYDLAERLAPVENRIRARINSVVATIKVGFLKLARVGVIAGGKIAVGAVGAFFDLAERLAPLENRLRAGLNRIVTAIKTPLLKLTARGVTVGGNFVVGFLKGLANFLDKLTPIETKIRSKISNLVTTIRDGSSRLAQSLGYNAVGAFITLRNTATRVFNNIKNTFKASWSEIQNDPNLRLAANNIGEAIGGLVGRSINGFNRIKRVAKSIWPAIENSPAVQIAAYNLGQAIGSVEKFTSTALGKVRAFGTKVANILGRVGSTKSSSGGMAIVNNGLKKITENSKLAQAAVSKVKTSLDSAFGPTSPVTAGLGKFSTGIGKLIAKLKEASTVFKKFFGLSKNYQTASYASGVNQALDQVSGGGAFTQFVGKLGRATGTIGRFVGRGALRAVGGGAGAVAGIGALAQSAANMGGQSAVTTAGDVLMTVGGAITMFAPQVGVPVMVGAAIVSQIGKSMDAAAEKSKQLAIKNAVINVANQTNAVQAAASLSAALGISTVDANEIVRKYSLGTGYTQITKAAQNITGTTFLNSGDGKAFVAALQAAVGTDSQLMTAVKANRALYPTILKLGIAIQQNLGMGIGSVTKRSEAAAFAAQTISSAIETDPTLSKLTNKYKGIIVSGKDGNIGLDKKQAVTFFEATKNSVIFKTLRSNLANAEGDANRATASGLLTTAMAAAASQIKAGTFDDANNVLQRIASGMVGGVRGGGSDFVGLTSRSRLYDRDASGKEVARVLGDLVAELKAEGVRFKAPASGKAPQIIISGDATEAQKTQFKMINKALTAAFNSR